MTDRKTNRKNKTNLVMVWPDKTDYFVIKSFKQDVDESFLDFVKNSSVKSLSDMNPEFINITLRVRLKKATDEQKIVKEIGYKNCGKGRPIKAFAMEPVSKEALDKAAKDGITIESPSSVPVIQINPDKTRIQHSIVAPTTKETVTV
jgi:hypothetical protein